MTKLDHLIIRVKDLQASLSFYTSVLGFVSEGTDGPFTVLRVNPDFEILLAAWPTLGSEHYAFAVSQAEFERIFMQIRSAGIQYGGAPDSVGSNEGPGEESGARGLAPTLYFHDPNNHLLEIRYYVD
jgi:catechol 2,3-dioxygenase-like lactoylglutathione lyase family enzyme